MPGWLFVPKNLDRSKKHPAIIWVHGDGINQNYDGWHIQRNYAVYYSYHQYLLQQGYVVFAPTIAAALATEETGATASIWMSVATTPRMPGWARTI